ncbi:hypothetical protein ACVIIV_002867 [Bradyrhizobium sp. USDA 4354]
MPCTLCKLSSVTLKGIQARLVDKLGELVRLTPSLLQAR